jgi:hypothetical protein
LRPTLGPAVADAEREALRRLGIGADADVLRIPIVRDRSVQFDVITSSDSY